MRKMRSDSTWSKLTPKQRRMMDEWYFQDGLSHAEILEDAEREFGIKATQQTLTSYFRYREKVRQWDGPVTFGRPEAVHLRRSRGLELHDLEARTVFHCTSAAYELSQADPDKMRVKELHTLMKMLSDRRYAQSNHVAKQEKYEFQRFLALRKLQCDEAKFQTKEELEKMMFDVANIWTRTKQKLKEDQAELEADRKCREGGSRAGAKGETEAERADAIDVKVEEAIGDDATTENRDPEVSPQERGGGGANDIREAAGEQSRQGSGSADAGGGGEVYKAI
jgi:hypothetical protein